MTDEKRETKILELLMAEPRFFKEIMWGLEIDCACPVSVSQATHTVRNLLCAGFIDSTVHDSRTMYTITEAGRAVFEERSKRDACELG